MTRSTDEINRYIAAHSDTETDAKIAKHLNMSEAAVRGRRRRMGAHKSLHPPKTKYKPVTHLVIPDTQVKPGVPTDNIRWIGQYIADTRPDVIVNLGDFWDMPSLSSYDKGKKTFEGRRYKADIKAGNDAFHLLDDPILQTPDYQPRHCSKIR